MGLYYEDYAVGQTFETMSRTVSMVEIVNYATLMGFFEEVFLSDEAAKDGPYGVRIAPGSLTFCLAEGLVVQTGILHGTGVAFLGVSDMRIPAPVRCGDTIRVQVQVTEKRLTNKPGRGVVKTAHRVINQAGQIVMEFSIARLILCREGGQV